MGKIYNQDLFAERLKELMDANNDNSYTIGEFLDMNQTTVSRYLNKEMNPKSITIEKLATRYNVNPVWLMGCETVEKYFQVDKVSKTKFKKIPVLGTIAAGQPILAEQYIEGYEYIDETENADFCLRIKGDSMINARIYDGDTVFIRQQDDVENGEIAAVLVDGQDATLKRVYKQANIVILKAENSKYQDMIFTKSDLRNIKILGKCIANKFYM